MPKVSDIYSELKVDISPFRSGIAQASSLASGLGKSLQGALGSDLASSVNQANQAMNSFISNSSNGMKSLSRIVQGILISQAFYGMVGSLKAAASEVANFQTKTETARVSFRYLTGSVENANAMLLKLQDIAAKTPFELDNIRDYAKQLLAAGYNGKDAIKVLQTLGDASAVIGSDPANFERVLEAMAKMKAQGKVTMKQLNSLATAGLPVFEIMREELGLTNDQLAEIGKMGISAEEGYQAIMAGLEKRFGGGAEEISKTTAGMLSNIHDNFVVLASGISEGLYEQFNGAISKVLARMDDLRGALEAGGLGGMLASLIPPEFQTRVSMVVGALQEIIPVLHDIASIAGLAFEPLLTILSALTPIIHIAAAAIHVVAEAARNGSAWIRILVGAVTGLTVLGVASKLVIGFAKALKSLMIVKYIKKAIDGLRVSIKLLNAAMIKSPIGAFAAVVTAALAFIVVSSDTASHALDALMQRLAKLFGVDLAEMYEPTEMEDDLGNIDDIIGGIGEDLDDAGGAADDMGDGIKDAGDKAGKAKKKVQDLLFAFDEVYRIKKDLDDTGDGGGGGGGDGGGAGGAGGGIPSFRPGGSKNPAEGLGESIREQLEKMGPIMLPGFIWPELPPLPQWEYTLEPWFEGLELAIEGFAAELQADWQLAFNMLPAMEPQLAAGMAVMEGWLNEVYERVRSWAGSTGVAVQEWGYSTGLTIATWAQNAAAAIGGFTTNTQALLDRWAQSNGLTAWAAEAIKNLGSVNAKAKETVNDWTAQTGGRIQAWATGAINTVATWANTTGTRVSSWASQTAGAIGTWATNTSSSVSNWATTTRTNVNNWATDTANRVGSWATETSDRFGTWAAENIVGFAKWKAETQASVGTWATNTWATIKKWSADTWADITKWLQDLTKDFSWDGAMGLVGKAFQWVWDEFLKFIKDFIKNALIALGIVFIPEAIALFKGSKAAAFLASVAAFFKPLTVQAKEKTDDAKKELDTLPPHAEGLESPMESAASRMAEGFKRAWRSAIDWVKSALSSLASAAGSSVSTPTSDASTGRGRSMNHMARGGMISKNQFIEIGERNRRETVVPLENPAALAPIYNHINDAVATAMESYGGSSMSSDSGPLRPLYVGTLVADERSLKELQRKMKLIEVQEDTRRGNQ